MPAAIVKSDINKLSNPEGSDFPIRQAIIIIEHKIRNLEKRKNKLESYRSIQFSGKELSNDQKTAVEKYNEVAQSLELARDFFKQLAQLSSNYEKEVKKQTRKESLLRAQHETSKIREVLILQDTLNLFENKESWNDFFHGFNGAIQLDQKEICVLKKFYSDVKTQQNNVCNNVDIQSEHFQKVAEYLSMTVDGRSKVYYDDFTFENMKELLGKVRNSEYKPVNSDPITEKNNVEKEIPNKTNEVISLNGDVVTENIENVDKEFKSEAPSATNLPPPFFSNSETTLKDIANENLTTEYGKFDEFNVLENEQQVNTKPFLEVIGDVNFVFIQDSEIDIPEIEAEHTNQHEHYMVQENQKQTIQSQTFTNQSMISNETQGTLLKISESNINTHENIELSSTSDILKMDSPNASNLPMPGFPALVKATNDDKRFQSGSSQTKIDWKSQVNNCETGKWSSNEDYKGSTTLPRTIFPDRNGNTVRSQIKQNGLRGNHNYFKNNDLYYHSGSTNSSFKSRSTRDRGNSLSLRQK
ncbi:CAPRIN1 family protein [Megaselia abdita]